MAKVILVWNEHPTEVVAGYHARKVAEILRRVYRHKVVRVRIPENRTHNGILANKLSKNTITRLLKLEATDVTKEHSEKHHAITFNFHASPANGMGRATLDHPNNFRVVEGEESTLDNAEILIEPTKGNYIIEVPAIFVPLPKRIGDRIKKNKRKTWDLVSNALCREPDVERRRKIAHISSALVPEIPQHTKWTHMKIKQQQKYLHPAISEKIAAAIHERISRKA